MVSSDMLWYSTITLRNRHLTGGFVEPPTSFEGQQLYSVCSELRVPSCLKHIQRMSLRIETQFLMISLKIRFLPLFETTWTWTHIKDWQRADFYETRHSGGIHSGCLITNAGMPRRLHDCLMRLVNLNPPPPKDPSEKSK